MRLEDDFLRRIQVTHQLLESGIPGLDDDQSKNVLAYCKLFLDTEFVSISSASYYRKTKVRKFLRKVNIQLGQAMLVLCMLSNPYTKLCLVNLEIIFPELQMWTKKNPGNKELNDLAKKVYEQYGMKKLLDSTASLPSPPQKKRKRSADRLPYESASNVSPHIEREDPGGHAPDNTSPAVPSDPTHNEEIQSLGQIHNNVAFKIDDMPGLQLYILKSHLPQSIVDIGIDQLVSWVQQYQSTSADPLQFENIVGILQDYQSRRPSLLCVQLIIPWYGPSAPYIDINIDSNMGWSAKIQLSLTLAYDLSQFVCGSWVSTTETANGRLA